MADVTPRRDRLPARSRAAGRGQLIMVTALALAVILVTVALLLNAAIFTQNIATRDTTTDGAEAIELRGDLVATVGELIETENWQGSGSPTVVSDGINATAPLVDRERGRYGSVATLDYVANTTGQTLHDSLDPGGVGGTEWRLVEDLTIARNFTVTVDPNSMDSGTPADIENDAFGVKFVNTSTENENVTQYIYRDSDEIVVAEANETSGPTRQCTIEHDLQDTTIDLSRDRLSTADDRTDCHRGLWTPEDPDAIEFVNTAAATGTFGLTVEDGDIPEISSDPAVYATTVEIGYHTRDLDFETTVRVAPGEPR